MLLWNMSSLISFWVIKLIPFQYKDLLLMCDIPFVDIRRSWDGLIFKMGIPILVSRHLYIEVGHRSSKRGHSAKPCNIVFRCRHAGGCFTEVSRDFRNNLEQICNASKHIYDGNFKLKLCTCAQSMGLDRNKVSSWNSQTKYDFCNTQISREYLAELTKC